MIRFLRDLVCILITYKKLSKVLSIVLYLFATDIFADFGESCSPLSSSVNDNYLRINSAYGHLIGNLDMTTYVINGCDSTDNTFKFCLKMPSTSSTPCTPTITLNIGDTRRLGDISTNPSLGGNNMLKDMVLTVSQIGSNICLTMPTSRGSMPIACKRSSVTPPVVVVEDLVCQNIGTSCTDGHSKSQSLLNFSGVAVHCLKETLDKVFYTMGNCIPDSIELQLLNPFPAFQETLKASIRAALIMYVIFYGFKVVLSGEYAELNNIATFLFKFILVAYFAVGLGPVFFKDGRETTQNGMLEIALPFLSQVAPQLAQIVFNAGGSQGLCAFDVTKYQHGYEFYALWDAIDCRIGYYLGMQLLYNMTTLFDSVASSVATQGNVAFGSPLDLGNPGPQLIEGLKLVGGFPFFTVMFGFSMAGNLIIVAAGIIFVIFFMSMILYFLSSYLVCLITLYAMAYISPIFITMALFERTKAYFDAWLKVVISCVIQPAVIAGFIALLLSMYDEAIYKNCEFMRHDYNLGTTIFSTFELRLPDFDPETCRNSAGYKLLKYYIGQAWEKANVLLFPIYYIVDILNLLVDLLYVFVFTVIFYFFSKSISQFAADLTNGPAMSAVVASPTKIVNAAVAAAKFAKAAASKDPKAMAKAAKGDSQGKGVSREGGKSGAGSEAKDHHAGNSD